ncbi:MAG: hypothetical protein K8H84_07865 [Sulfuricella denitrificans]|nr:hypothetical protein [Sulfuricella denitrificans]
MLVQKNLPFFNVVAAGVATLQLSLGMTYERIIMVLGGTAFTKAMITDIKCKINGKVFYQTTGSRLDSMNKYKGIFDAAGFLTLDFTEIFARDEVGQSIGAIGTLQGVASFTIEVTIAGATAPTLESYSILSGPKKLGVVNKLLHYPSSSSVGGKVPVVLPYGVNGGSILKRVYFFHGGNMTGLEVKKNGLVIHESTAAVNEFLQKENKKVPQANLYVYDPIVDNNQSGMVVTADARSFEFNVTLSAADALNVYGEYVDQLGNL